MERTYKICVLKTTSKMLDSCNIWPFYHDFHRLKSSYLFFISRILYKILDEVKLKEIVFDNFLLSIIHVFRGFFRSILWSCFYYGILLNPKSRAHFCSDWVYSSFAVIFSSTLSYVFTKAIYDLIKILPHGLPFGFSLQTDMVRRKVYGPKGQSYHLFCLFWCITSHSRIFHSYG